MTHGDATPDRASLLEHERRFFDEQAAAFDDARLHLSEETLEQYRNARPRATNGAKDWMFSLLHPLAGKRVLEYGCGTGDSTCLLAAAGATVTALDLSPVSIAKTRRRAELLGLTDRVHVLEAAAGALDFPDGSFDVAFGAGFLHHVHTELPAIYAEIGRLLRPGGVACFSEPVANSRALAALRRVVPVPLDSNGTERQLTYADFEGLSAHFSSVELHHVYLLERAVVRLVPIRSLCSVVRAFDHYVDRLLPAARPLFGQVIVYAVR